VCSICFVFYGPCRLTQINDDDDDEELIRSLENAVGSHKSPREIEKFAGISRSSVRRIAIATRYSPFRSLHRHLA